MKPICRALLLSLIVCVPLHAQEAKPTEESVRALLKATDAQKIVDAMVAQTDQMIKSMMQKLSAGQQISAAQQKAIDTMRVKATALMKEELNWTNLEPVYLQVYADTFTQSEVDGMLAFYRSQTGQAVIQKLPAVMQNTMALMQGRMTVMAQKLQQMARETAAEIQKQSAEKPDEKSS